MDIPLREEIWDLDGLRTLPKIPHMYPARLPQPHYSLDELRSLEDGLGRVSERSSRAFPFFQEKLDPFRATQEHH